MSDAERSDAAVARFTVLVAFALCGAGCGGPAALAGFGKPTPRDGYERRLRNTSPTGSALVRDWRAAGERALNAALPVTTTFREALYFPDDEATAVGYRLELKRGQRLHVEVEPPAHRKGRLFLELFQVIDNAEVRELLVARGRDDGYSLDFRAPRGGTFVLRVQPEIQTGGRYRVASRIDGPVGPAAGLVFPVAGRDSRAIRSRFGAPRDGGRRRHRGVDIFAPRRTPVRAAVDGVITAVRRTGLGGNVIWLNSLESNLSFYYAHLHAQLVERGQRVRAGEIIGLVGNTGNARTTPPHLHFGVYRRGRIAIDPTPFLRGSRLEAPRLTEIQVAIGSLGRWATPNREGLILRASPDPASRIVAELAPDAVLRLIGGIGAWYRVRLPDGRSGFVRGSEIKLADRTY